MTQTAPSLRLPSRTSLAAFAALAFMLIALQGIMRASSTGDYERFSARHADLLGSPARGTTAGSSCSNLASGSTCTLTWNVPANQPVGNYTLNARVTDANGQMATLARVITLNPAAKITYYHTDPLGSPVLATDSAGNVAWREGYGAFGDRLKKPAAADNVGYTGKQHDNASGLSYFGARWYDPAIGRFMGYDPAGFDEGNPGSFNRYGYGNNNPYKFVDPDGRTPVHAAYMVVVGASWAAARYGPAVNNAITQIANSPTTHAVVEAVAGIATNSAGALSGVAAGTSKAIVVTEQSIRAALTSSNLLSAQKSISIPLVSRYVDMIKNGEVAPAIHVDGNALVNGHHRLAAGILTGKPPSVTPGTLAPSRRESLRPIREIEIDARDFGSAK